ncbi:MAG: MobA/MobL family protein [Mesorhizobium sp.]
MADFFRIQLGVVSRAEGHCAAKRSAYQSCGVVVAHDGERFDFSRKMSEHIATIMLTPPDAPDWARHPQTLWQRAATAEKRVDAQEARIIDFSMPRAIPAKLWADCIQHVYEPFLRMGMVLQVDVHDTPASDGGRNVNVHGLATLREIDGDGFAGRKNRTWNDHFRERNGRAVRGAFAERLTAFCREEGIAYVGDARPNAERDLPDPEPELPRWNFEHLQRTGEMTEALDALRDHRKRRRRWEAAQADAMEAGLDLKLLEVHVRERRKRRIAPAAAADSRASQADRRAAVLRAWHGCQWIDVNIVSAIASTRYDTARGCLWIDLKDGSMLVDRGDSVALRGRLTWQAALETAAAAERHGWESVDVHGDQAYKDAVAVACMLRNIEVTNHTLSPKAQVGFDTLRADSVTVSGPKRQPEALSSRDIHRELTKRRFVEESPLLDGPSGTEELPFSYKPRFRPLKKKKPDCSKV